MTNNQSRLVLFATGFIQVLLVAVNTWQISRDHLVGATIVGFMISFVWTLNVKRVAFGSHADRVIYAGGAALGTLVGIIIARALYS